MERLFEIGINVYIFERFEDALRPVLIKSKGGDKQLNVVYLSGRFLYVKDIKTFFNTYTVADDTNRENARLQWIRSHKHVLTLDKNSNGQRYRGGVSSFFRCLAVHRKGQNVNSLARQYEKEFERSLPKPEEGRKVISSDPAYRNDGEPITARNIYREVDYLERLFEIKINIYRLSACSHNGTEQEDHAEATICPSIVRLSINDQFPDTLHLLAYKDHFCYITDINYLSQTIVCSKCQKACPRRQYSSHFAKCRGAKTYTTFNRKTFSIPRTLKEDCRLRGIDLHPDLEFREFYMCWDIEAYCCSESTGDANENADEGVPIPIVIENSQTTTSRDDNELNLQSLKELLAEAESEQTKNAEESDVNTFDKTNKITETSNTQYTTPHTLLSIGCCSNVPNYCDPKVFITNGDSQELVDRFMNYAAEVQVAAGKLIAPLVRSTVKQILKVEQRESSSLWQELDKHLSARLKERLQTDAGVAQCASDGGIDEGVEHVNIVRENVEDSVVDNDNDGSDDESDLNFHPLDFDEEGLNVEKDPDEPRAEKVCLPSRSERSVSALIGRLTSECRVLSIVGFNSGNYDTNAISKYLLPYFNSSLKARKKCQVSDNILHTLFFPQKKKKGEKRRNKMTVGQAKRAKNDNEVQEECVEEEEEEGEEFVKDESNDAGGSEWNDSRESTNVIKKGSRYLILSNARFRFLDIANFTPMGTSYAEYLKGFKIKDSKLSFPYDYVTSLKVLDETQLPSKEDFFNSMKQRHLTDEEYARCQQLWREQGMTTFRDYLIAYNSMDVAPFVQALAEQKRYFQKEEGVHLFDYVSIPAVTERLLHRGAPHGTWFSTLSKQEEDLYEKFNGALQGGPSIIFHRLSFGGDSLIRPKEPEVPDRQTVQKIVGLGKFSVFMIRKYSHIKGIMLFISKYVNVFIFLFFFNF